jgi:hypothetical protein
MLNMRSWICYSVPGNVDQSQLQMLLVMPVGIEMLQQNQPYYVPIKSGWRTYQE